MLLKDTFSACDDESVRRAIRAIDRPQVILIGIEAHVCIQQTALDLRAMDYDVFVCADAVGSRGRFDYDCALQRMRQAGALVKSAIILGFVGLSAKAALAGFFPSPFAFSFFTPGLTVLFLLPFSLVIIEEGLPIDLVATRSVALGDVGSRDDPLDVHVVPDDLA